MTCPTCLLFCTAGRFAVLPQEGPLPPGSDATGRLAQGLHGPGDTAFRRAPWVPGAAAGQARDWTQGQARGKQVANQGPGGSAARGSNSETEIGLGDGRVTLWTAFIVLKTDFGRVARRTRKRRGSVIMGLNSILSFSFIIIHFILVHISH